MQFNTFEALHCSILVVVIAVRADVKNTENVKEKINIFLYVGIQFFNMCI